MGIWLLLHGYLGSLRHTAQCLVPSLAQYPDAKIHCDRESRPESFEVYSRPFLRNKIGPAMETVKVLSGANSYRR